jgi:hypothetical protein
MALLIDEFGVEIGHIDGCKNAEITPILRM